MERLGAIVGFPSFSINISIRRSVHSCHSESSLLKIMLHPLNILNLAKSENLRIIDSDYGGKVNGKQKIWNISLILYHGQ